MVYIRGQREDYDHWSELGNAGWSYEEVLPYFKRSEHKAEGANDWHGYGGPLWVEDVADEQKLDLADIYIQAAIQSGLPYNEDFNGATQEGVGYYQTNIRKGRAPEHCAHVPEPVQETAQPDHRHRRPVPADPDRKWRGRRRRIPPDRKKHPPVERAYAQRRGHSLWRRYQFATAAGAVGHRRPGTPATLGIPVRQHLPGVGENLQDHLTINIQQGLHGVPTFFEETRPLAMIRNIVKYLLKGTRPARSPGGAGRGILSHR